LRDRRVYLPPDRDRRPRSTGFRFEAGRGREAPLWSVCDQVRRDRDAIAADGFTINLCRVIQPLGLVLLRVAGASEEDAARAYFRERYGDAVRVHWLGPDRYAERPRAFGSWTAAGRILRVFSAIDRNGERTGSATLRAETHAEIVVAVTCLVPLGPSRRVGGYKRRHHDLVLGAPVGDRRVIDAATGNARRPVWEIPTH